MCTGHLTNCEKHRESNLKVLVVEDETEIRNNLCSLLRMQGYDAPDAANGK